MLDAGDFHKRWAELSMRVWSISLSRLEFLSVDLYNFTIIIFSKKKPTIIFDKNLKAKYERLKSKL